MSDRAVPFTLSLKVSQITRLERVLQVAAMQGRLQSDASRVNKLACELLMQALATLEQEYIAQGILTGPTQGPLPALPIAPTTYAAILPPGNAPQALLSPANDPAYRAQIRAAHDARTAQLTGGGALHAGPSLAELEAAYRAQGAAPAPLVAPDDLDGDRAP